MNTKSKRPYRTENFKKHEKEEELLISQAHREVFLDTDGGEQGEVL